MPGDAAGDQRDWDGVWKRVLEHFPLAALQVLCGVDVTGATVTELPTERQRPVFADRVFRVRRETAGRRSDEIVHVEVQAHRDPGFELRLATYYVLLAAAHRAVPRQVVILPRGGPWTGTFVHGPLTLTYQVVDVRRLDTSTLLGTPLAPLALWTSPNPLDLVGPVVETIASTPGHEPRITLTELAILAGPEVAATVVAAMKERGMKDLLRGTDIAEEWLAEGRAEGAALGRAAGRAALLRALLVSRFGEDPLGDAAAAALAQLDDAEALRRLDRATSLRDISG